MAYWVYGRDSQTGEKTNPFFSEAATEDAARAEATAQSMLVEWVETHVEERARPGASFTPAPETKQTTRARMRLAGPWKLLLGIVGLLAAVGLLHWLSGSNAEQSGLSNSAAAWSNGTGLAWVGQSLRSTFPPSLAPPRRKA